MGVDKNESVCKNTDTWTHIDIDKLHADNPLAAIRFSHSQKHTQTKTTSFLFFLPSTIICLRSQMETRVSQRLAVFCENTHTHTLGLENSNLLTKLKTHMANKQRNESDMSLDLILSKDTKRSTGCILLLSFSSQVAESDDEEAEKKDDIKEDMTRDTTHNSQDATEETDMNKKSLLQNFSPQQTINGRLMPLMEIIRRHAPMDVLKENVYRNFPDLRQIDLNDLVLQAIKMDAPVAAVEFFAEQGANLNCSDEFENTPLHTSILKNRVDIVSYLLSRDVNVDWKNKDEFDALHTAVKNGRLEILKLLIAAGASVDCFAGNLTAVHTAILERRWDELKLLIEAGADTAGRRESYRMHGQQYTELGEPSQLAAKSEDTKHLIPYLTPKTSNLVNLPNSYNASDVRGYISRGDNVNCRNSAKDTLIHLAVISKKHDVMRVLLYAGANVNLRNNNEQTPLCCAVTNGDLVAVDALSSAGANLNTLINRNDVPLTHAARGLQTQLCVKLLTIGADVNGTNKNGQTALHVVVGLGDTPQTKNDKMDVLKALVYNGANLDAQDTNGDTALHIAVKNCKVETIEFLIKHQAGVNIKNREGHTPLFYAIRVGYVSVLKCLIDAGARVDMVPSFQRTLQLATHFDDVDFINALLYEKTKPPMRSTTAGSTTSAQTHNIFDFKAVFKQNGGEYKSQVTKPRVQLVRQSKDKAGNTTMFSS